MKKGFDFEKTEKKLSGLYSGLLGAAPAVDAVARSRTAPVNKGESRGIFGRPSFQIVSAVLAAVIIGGGAFFGITLLRSQSHGGTADTTVSDAVDTTDKETHRSDTTGGATVPDDKTGKMTISAVFGENQSVLEGDCFDVDVKLENVKELSSLRLTVFWDPELTLVRAEFGDVGGIKDISDSTEPPCSFNWLALEDDAVIRDDTTFLRLSFTVPVSEDHTWKQYNISLSADPENVFDANGENVAFEIRNLSFSSVVPVQSVPETVTGPVSETTGDDTTEPDTTGPAATEPETTEPETTEPETTAPKTTVIATESDTEPPATEPTHEVRTLEGTFLRSVSGERFMTNSFHHQGVKDPAPGLRVAALAADGMIEALESVGDRFILLVQWHPEFTHSSDPVSDALFTSFIEAAKA